ncbi:MAG: DUF4331 domain-containing protein [Blastocatellia bacterium]|nr:DUF4331 domain-containing protein [Blastocatellia bacterium]
MKALSAQLKRGLAFVLAATMTLLSVPFDALASSHMDAPLITRDPSANTTDVYAFVTEADGQKYLTVALGVYPHQNPGIGPNKYNFDENVRYEIHIARGNDLTIGYPTMTYRFEFDTDFKSTKTILQSYLGVIQDVGDANQNLTQSYTITRLNNRTGSRLTIGGGLVPPNNQGIATPFYNEGDNGENPARKGVATEAELDKYTKQGIFKFRNGYWAFAGQRDDGFYADVQSIFDLLQLRNPGKDAQGGFNVHLMALRIPMSELGGDQQTVGVFATTSRPVAAVSRALDGGGRAERTSRNAQYVQVARQGNPLFNEGLVALADKDLYSRTLPTVDRLLFKRYAENPELATLINLIIGKGATLAIDKDRADIAAIFIPDVIKVDLSTSRTRLAGNGKTDAKNPDDAGFSRLGIFGGDVLESPAAGHPFRLSGKVLGADANKFYVPGGWPNGRRFGDDVVDIAIIALLSDLRDGNNPKISDPFMGNYDGVTGNDQGFNKTFPYEPTPQNGRVPNFAK